MKQKIIDLLMGTGRKGMEDLIQHMEEGGFFTAPCSSQFHLCKEEGLAEHSLNVYDIMNRFNKAPNIDFIFEITNVQGVEKDDSVAITSLLHDLGKMGQYGKPNYIENILASGKRSDKKPYETNKDLLAVPHEVRSVQIASQFIELTEDESYAILMHNALYGPFKYEYSGKETKLSLLLHWADMWASRVIEKEDK